MKEKNKKSTLNNHHRIILDNFKKESKKLPKYKLDLEKLRKRLEKLDKKNPKKCTDKEIDTKFQLKDQINLLTIKIETIEKQKGRTDYILNTFDYLNEYFLNRNNCNDCEEPPEPIEENPTQNTNTLVNFFKKKDDKQMSMNSFINKTNKIKNSDLYDKYLNKIEPKYSGKYEFINNFDLCIQCKIKKTLIQNEGRYVCQGCGRSDNIIIESEKPSYKEALSSDISALNKIEYIIYNVFFFASKISILV